jgi:hypothetical protein
VTEFIGFQQDCPGMLRDTGLRQEGTRVRFEMDGKALDRAEAGHKTPTAFRVIHEDSFEGSLSQDRVTAFDIESARLQRNRNDFHVTEKGILVLSDASTEILNETCTDCSATASDQCPILEGILEGTIALQLVPLHEIEK